MRKVIYEGFFVNLQDLAAKYPGILFKQIACPHVTTKYRPKDTSEDLYGETVMVKVIGYGCDGKNEGLKVEVITDNPKLKALYDAIPVPHITVSISEDGKAVDTSKLVFEPFDDADIFFLEARFGGFTGPGVVFG